MGTRPTVLLMTALLVLSGATIGFTGTVGAQESSATVEFSAQTSGGSTVTVDSVTLPDGGFVTLHDASLNDGNVLGSVVGSSAYLEAGTHENVTVRLDEPLSEDATLVAMPHMDTNDNRIYEFVSGNGQIDGPYTMDGDIVVASANVTASATVTASAQPTDGMSFVVDRVELSQPGFVAMHNQTLLDDGDAVGSVVGHSEYLSAGVHENVRITLDAPIGNETVVPMAHMDTNDNQEYDFPDADGPFTDMNGDIVLDTAETTVSNTATVSFENQSSGGTRVVVDELFLPNGGFVVMHDSTLVSEGDAVGSVRGPSEYLAPGLHRNVVVDLNRSLTEDDTLVAMPHLDTNGNEMYEFPDADGPYTADGGAVVDSGNVTVSASVSMDVQRSGGHTITVDSVDLSEGGFIAVHDSSLFAGNVAGSVVGHSEYLEAGVHEDVTVTLSTPVNESQVLVPMAHMDTDGDEAYTFPDADGPYTYDGGAVVDTAKTIVPASVTMSDQESMGETVVVDSVTLSDGGFVTIHDSTVLDGQVFESIRGTSDYLTPGTHKNVEITLDTPLEADDTLVPMAHRDTDGDETYTFVESEGQADGPYTANGAVVDTAAVTFTGQTMTETPTATPTPEMTEEMTEEPTDSMETTETTSPGFGVVLALVALAGAALLAARRQQ